MRSHGREIRVGDLVADFSGFIRNGFSAVAFRGKDRQSDREAFVFLLFCHISSTDPLPSNVLAALVLNLVITMVSVAWESKNLTLRARHLLCAIAFYFFRMCRNYVDDIAKAEGFHISSLRHD